MDFLLGCAASVDASSDDGDRPLHLSAWMGHADATARLIEGEANVDAPAQGCQSSTTSWSGRRASRSSARDCSPASGRSRSPGR